MRDKRLKKRKKEGNRERQGICKLWDNFKQSDYMHLASQEERSKKYLNENASY
jgi:hypothetical protein